MTTQKCMVKRLVHTLRLCATDTFGWPKARCTFPAFVTRSSWRDLAGSRAYRANDMGDSIVITFSASSSSVTAASPQQRFPRQRQSPQQSADYWHPETLILCHSVLETNATSDFFVAETFVLDGWSVMDRIHALFGLCVLFDRCRFCF